MKIAFDHQIFSGQRYGGISRYFFELAHCLANGSSDVRVHVNSPLYVNEYLSRAGGLINLKGVHLPDVRGSRRISLAVNYLLSPHFMKKIAPDVVHETYYSKCAFAPRGCPVVITVYDMIHELFPGSFPGQDRTSQIKRAAIERADHVVCISENTRNDLVRLLAVPEKKISIVHLGFEKLSPLLDEGANTKKIKPLLLYVGSRGGYKNFSAMLRAISLSPRLMSDFDIVAFGGGAFSFDELSLIDSLGFRERQVKQIGGDDSLLGTLYSSASALVYPSIYEGFGLPPLEAMAHSCPVVSSNSSSMPEVIGDAGEFFDPLSVEDMAAAIERVVYDVSFADNLRARGHLRLGQFSWQRCASETMSIYKSLQR